MTDEQLAEIEDRANVATPGPWRWVYNVPDDEFALPRLIAGDDTVLCHFGWGNGYETLTGQEPDRIEDDLFIAHARMDIPALITEVRNLRCELEDERINREENWGN